MNKQLEKLNQEAVDWALSVGDAVGCYQGKDYLQLVKEKFAELIVLETIRYFNVDYVRDWDTPWREDLASEIKQHFGIK